MEVELWYWGTVCVYGDLGKRSRLQPVLSRSLSQVGPAGSLITMSPFILGSGTSVGGDLPSLSVCRALLCPIPESRRK